MLGWRYESLGRLKMATSTQQHTILKKWLKFPQYLSSAVCAATAEILFLRGTDTGALLLAAMLLQPGVLCLGLTGVLATVLFAKVAHLGDSYLEWRPFLFNPLLAGLSVGYLFKPGIASLFLASVAGILAFILTWFLSHVLRTFLLLPVLSLPFIAVSWMVHLAAFRYAGLQPAIVPAYAYSVGLPLPIEGFLRTLGLIFFLPNVWVGTIVALLLLKNSRIQFFLAVSGYLVGTSIRAILTGTFAYVYYDPSALNFILVALAIGGFYLVPSPRSYALAGIGVAASAVLGEAASVFWAAVALPVHALPYNLVTLLLLYVLGLTGHRGLAKIPQSSPENTLDYELTARLRYQNNARTIALPFAGSWVVWQGFDGKWTHQGIWRYAYDFLIADEQGLTYTGTGIELKDYYAFQKPVLSPVRGWVVRVVKDLPDCLIGTVDHNNNWGNYVVVYDERGFYVEISHFSQHSIVVNQGDRIERGMLLGKCGNSGYSPQPHIHIQVQLFPDLASATVPFSFANVRVNGDFFAESIPQETNWLENATFDTALVKAFTFILDSKLHFTVMKKGRKIGELMTTVKMAVDGSFYLDSGKAKLFFSCNDDSFIFHRLEGDDPFLAMLFIAIPKLPLIRPEVGQQWSDFLPVGIVTKKVRRLLYQFGSSFFPLLGSACYTGMWEAENRLSGVILIPGVKRKILTATTFAGDGQLLSISVGELSLVRDIFTTPFA